MTEVHRSAREWEIINTVPCPKCRAKRQHPCRYIDNTSTAYSRPDPRVGFPTKQVHAERRDRFRAKEYRERREQVSAEQQAVVAAKYGHWQALRSLREFDMQEHKKMLAWIRANVHIFFLEDS